MTNEEILSHFKYYHGEKKCPYDRGDDASAFWFWEKWFYKDYVLEPRAFDAAVDTVKRYIASHTFVEGNPYTDDSVHIVTKCIIYYIVQRILKWDGDMDMVYRY